MFESAAHFARGRGKCSNPTAGRAALLCAYLVVNFSEMCREAFDIFGGSPGDSEKLLMRTVVIPERLLDQRALNKTVKDFIVKAKTMAGFDARDSTSLERPKEDYARSLRDVDLAGLRIGAACATAGAETCARI